MAFYRRVTVPEFNKKFIVKQKKNNLFKLVEACSLF